MGYISICVGYLNATAVNRKVLTRDRFSPSEMFPHKLGVTFERLI